MNETPQQRMDRLQREYNPPPWFIYLAAVAIFAIGVVLLIQGEPWGAGMLVVAAGWAIFARIWSRHPNRRR